MAEIDRRTLLAGMTGLAAGTATGGMAAAAARPAPLRVSADGARLQTDDGRPFFWLADTAWDLAYRTTPAEALAYLDKRAAQRFTVVQVVALSENDGIHTATDLGFRPFRDGDPGRPNPRFFDHFAWLVDQAGVRGLYVALLPSWGDKLTAPWGTGPRLFRAEAPAAAATYGRFLGRRLAGRSNLVWMLGGDRPVRLGPGPADWWARRAAVDAGWPGEADWRPVWRAMAAGLAAGAGDANARPPLIAYHPQAGPEGTVLLLPDEPWLALNGLQSGHGGGHDAPVWDWIARDRAADPRRPVIDLEMNYEDHPVNPWPRWNPVDGYFRDADVRAQAYRGVFAGAAGVTYGHHAVWQFAGPRHPGVNHVDRDWRAALDRPGAWQMRHLRALMEAHPPARERTTPLVRDNGEGARHVEATGGDGWLLAYLPVARRALSLDVRALGPTPVGRWFDPRSGGVRPATGAGGRYRAPGPGDWVLALAAAGRDRVR